MNRQLLHTPEGVRDICDEECEKKLALEDTLHQIMIRYGYRPIQTPTFEFFDMFSHEIGTTPAQNLYKFFDREGNTLVLRPDMTPSVARCAAKYYSGEYLPLRLCYMGNIFINNSSYQGRLKECTQLGAELIGDSSASADAELLAMAVACFQAAGLKEFFISVGHADFIHALAEAAGLGEEQTSQLLTSLSNKNFFGVEAIFKPLQLEPHLNALFGLLGNFQANENGLAAARSHAANYPRIKRVVDYLFELHELLKVYDITDYVSFDLGSVSDYRYYTGIIFTGYTLGSGAPVLRGGRYDRLLSCFGKEAAAIGFAVIIDRLMDTLLRQGVDIPLRRETILLVYEPSRCAQAIREAKRLRGQGSSVALAPMPEDAAADALLAYAQKREMKLLFLSCTDD